MLYFQVVRCLEILEFGRIWYGKKTDYIGNPVMIASKWEKRMKYYKNTQRFRLNERLFFVENQLIVNFGEGEVMNQSIVNNSVPFMPEV